MARYTLYSEVYAVNESLDISLFSTRSSRRGDNTIYIWLGLIIVFCILIVLLVNWRNAKKIKKATSKFMKNKDESVIPAMSFFDDTSERIGMLANAINVHPQKLLESNKVFEMAVAKLIKNSSTDPLLLKIPSLREDLGYTFYSRKAKFICTQMLQTGQKLRIGVNFKGKSHYYVGTILNINEDEFWVKPPTVKGKSVDLSKFKSFNFSVFRKNDGEYRFACKLKSQITTPANALVMAHVKKIKKLKTREHERYLLKFKREFHFSDLKIEKSACEGIVVDISIGGLKFQVKEIPEGAAKGMSVFFSMNEANISQEIRAEIVRMSKKGDQSFVHLQFQDMSELNRLHLQKFVASKNSIKVK